MDEAKDEAEQVAHEEAKGPIENAQNVDLGG